LWYVSGRCAEGRTVRKIICADNMAVLPGMPSGSVDLVYVDPPFNTGRIQQRTTVKAIRDETGGDRVAFQGRLYRTVSLGTKSFVDVHEDYLAFMQPRLFETHRLLKPGGSFFLHADYREVHYLKVLLDGIFGRKSFMNEIIWAYDYGGRPRRRWPAKHDTILWYAKDPRNYTFCGGEIDRIPYMAPDLVGSEKAARGKTPTDVWWHTIVGTNSKEKTGYPTQKPLGVLSRIVKVHSKPGDLVLDYFAGSGTTGEAAARAGRDFVLIDSSPDACRIMARRLEWAGPELQGFESDSEEASGTRPRTLFGGDSQRET